MRQLNSYNYFLNYTFTQRHYRDFIFNGLRFDMLKYFFSLWLLPTCQSAVINNRKEYIFFCNARAEKTFSSFE